MKKDIILTGITTTGTPHLGNYVGAIRCAIEASRNPGVESFLFLADYHALIKCHEPARIQRSSLEVAATWLACGLDTDRVTFYRQSDIPEIMELNWLLTSVCAKGLLNRAHAYKAAVDANAAEGRDADKAVTMGLFNYPILMAADILMFNAAKVPVGRDQIQHIEMARDMGQRFNHMFAEKFILPEAVVEENAAILPGLDGRKMSKSYHNTIPLFLPEDKLRKKIMSIVTNSLEPGVPKDPDASTVFALYRAFASEADTRCFRTALEQGLAWGEAKQQLFESLNAILAEPRARYTELIANPSQVDMALRAGAQKARAKAIPFMRELKEAVGISPMA